MSDEIELRIMVPRDRLPLAAAPAPDYYSQENCTLLGLTRRAFLELLRTPGAPAVRKLGKLRLVERAAMLRFLERLPTVDRGPAAKPAEVDGVDRVLFELGCTPQRRAG